MCVRSLDDHIGGGIHIDTRRMTRIRLKEPDDDRDVVGDSMKRHGDRTICLKEIDGTAVVVHKRCRFGL